MNPWPRNDYLAHAAAEGASSTTALASWKQSVKLQRKGLPPVLSLKHLAVYTKNTYQHLRAIVARDVEPYRIFQIKKRSGGYRHICVPEPGLMRAQRWIDRFILSPVPVHSSAKAYANGSSIVKCAMEHAGCEWLVKCDVRQFFESISEIQAYRVFKEVGYQPLVAFELARICTRIVVNEPGRNKRQLKYEKPQWRRILQKQYAIREYENWKIGHLPQGAPTSPRLSNLVMRQFDETIHALAEERDLTYTRYADDLIFSRHGAGFDREQARGLIGRVFEEMHSVGLRAHTTKTVVAPPGARKVVLGLCVNDSKPRLPRELKKRIACHSHYVCRFGIVRHARQRKFDSIIGFREHFKGLLRFASQVEPEFVKAIMNDLRDSDWDSI